MNLHTHRMAWMCWSVGLSLAVVAQAATTTQPAATSQPAAAKAGAGVGLVKGNNVYIRSGFSTNYYPVTKLNAGDELKIVGEEFGWLKVVPPAGTFSLVDKNFVDKVGDKKGVLNGKAMVYAGSNIDDRRYAKQVSLSKGDAVQIIGETSDGAFYKIEPPAGSHLWIKADLVDRNGAVSPNHPGLETVPPGGLGLADGDAKAAKPATPRSKAPAGATASVEKKVNEPSAEIGEKYLLEINSIEAEIQAEATKPLGERQFGPIIARLEPIAAQSEDEVSQLYATTRIDQLRGHSELAGAVKELRGLTEKAMDNADEIAKERAKLRAQEAKPMDDIALRGEIRVSSIYSGSGILPKRWRIVDPQTNRTQAYIEVPEGSGIDPAQYYGKFVGIRATGYRILRESVQPLPIYTVKEIVLQDKSQQGNMPGAGFIASPPESVPLIVAQPSSQPAAAEKTAEPAATSQPEQN